MRYIYLFGLELIVDNDGNMILTEGLVLQAESYWKDFLKKDVAWKNNSCELYFEESDIDGFAEKLEKLYPETEYVNRLMTHSWGQKVIRFYDLVATRKTITVPKKKTRNTGDNIMEIVQELYKLADEKYADFQAKLTPNVDRKLFIGVRVPNARKLAKEIYKLGDYEMFLAELPHKYYDEYMLHGLILSEFKDYDNCISEVDRFLPYVDNWAVCDIMSPKCFKKNKDKLIEKILEWSSSNLVYTCRFGMEMLMTYFLDEDFRPEYLEIPAKVKNDDYYAKMMVAWFFATALAKQWDATIPYIENKKLGDWTHKKTIQKARESYRITDEQKEHLKTLTR